MIEHIKNFCSKTVTMIILLASLLIVGTLATTYADNVGARTHAQVAHEFEKASAFDRIFGNPFAPK